MAELQEAFKAVMDGYSRRDFSGWDILGVPDEGMYCIGLGDALRLVHDSTGMTGPFILELLGVPFIVRSIRCRRYLVFELEGFMPVARSTGP